MIKKKKSYFILMWIFFTSIFLTVSSYAWLSANKIFAVQTFNIHIATKGDLEVSSDGINWKGVITLADIIEARKTYPGSVNQIPRTLKPVSSGGIVENGFLKIFYGELMGEGNESGNVLTSIRSVESEGFGVDSTGIFVAFDLFFNTFYRTNLYLTPLSSVEPLEDLGSGIENSFRVAFLNQGTLPPTAPIREIQGLKKATKAYIWEPNYDAHTAKAIIHAKQTYGIETVQRNAARITYDGIIKEFGVSDNVRERRANAVHHPGKFKRVEPTIVTSKNFTTPQKILELEAGITKVRIYIWMEGQDVDCILDASVGEVLINFQLSTEQPK